MTPVQWTEQANVTATKTLRWLNIQFDADLLTANVSSVLSAEGDGEKELPPTDERRSILDCTPEVQKAIQALAEAFSAQLQGEAVVQPTLQASVVAAAQA